MKKGITIPLVFCAGVIVAGSCNSRLADRKSPLPFAESAGSIAAEQPLPVIAEENGDSAGYSGVRKPQDRQRAAISGERMLNEADKRYIDLLIPDYPDVILWHEGSPGTLGFTEEVYQYLLLKNANVKKKRITKTNKEKSPNNRLHIADVGENWYEVYIFDDGQ